MAELVSGPPEQMRTVPLDADDGMDPRTIVVVAQAVGNIDTDLAASAAVAAAEVDTEATSAAAEAVFEIDGVALTSATAVDAAAPAHSGVAGLVVVVVAAAAT